MNQPSHLANFPRDEAAVIEDEAVADAFQTIPKSPVTKARSMSDGGGTPSKLSPSPRIIENSRRTSKDDSNLRDLQPPVTPRRSGLSDLRGLSLQMPPRQFTPPAGSSSYAQSAPLSPKLDHSQIYASPTNLLPRRSRGLDFSRAATSLHHSTLAEQSSPESSPTIGDRAMNIPRRRGEYGGPEQTSTSLWSVMGNSDRLMNMSSSVGSAQAIGSDSTSSSGEDELMDEDMDEAYVTTPQTVKTTNSGPVGGPFGSPAMSSLVSFQQRQRPRKQQKKKMRAPLGLGFNIATASISKSPPRNAGKARRESISWQANQLHISSTEGEESGRSLSDVDTANGEGQKNVIRRVVTRRGNLLPKTKTFARIRAALAEEGAPADAECRREAEVVKQVRESDMELEPRGSISGQDAIHSAMSSPSLANQDSLDDIPEGDMVNDLAAGLSSSFKQQAMRNSKGKPFWDTFSECSSIGGTRTTPPPPPIGPRGSSSGMSEDATLDSPSLVGPVGWAVGNSQTRAESQRCDTAQAVQNGNVNAPSAAEITRRINNKRRREDDFDPNIFKRRAVSPGMSAHNSPIPQSPLQRDSAPWGSGSRPGSTGGDKGASSAPSESGSMGSTPVNTSGATAGPPGRVNSKGRVGMQGMVDTNDGIMRMSIE